MDSLKAIQAYINKMTNEVAGMKVLLLDQETTQIISVVYTQSQLLQKEIYLIDRIENKREQMKHLKCIVFLRPTLSSIQYLLQELHEPCFSDYYIYFSNTINKSSLERLAEGDSHQVVREVQEYFADFIAVNPGLVSLSINYPIYTEGPSTWAPMALARAMEGITGMLLAFKKKPLIRYESNSVLARKLANEYAIQNDGQLYDFRKPDTPPILVIMDRRNDSVTPLLSQWTYQSMIHELLGITNGRVDLSKVKDVRPEMKEIVLNVEHDQFFAKNMYLNLGDLGENIKTFVEEFQVKHNSTKKIESINDMKRFVEDYPEFRKLSGNVSKHVTLVGELSKQIAQNKLLEIGELEQSLAISNNHQKDSQLIQQFLLDPALPNFCKLRLVLLYALRYEKQPNNQLQLFQNLLKQNGSKDEDIKLVDSLLQYSNNDFRLDPIVSNDFLDKTKNMFKGLQGVENVYTQHTPRIVNVVNDLIKGKVKDNQYPFLEGSTKDKPQDIFLFMIGGATYTESMEIQKLNSTTNRIILGGTHIHNSETFLDFIKTNVSEWKEGDKGVEGQPTNVGVQRSAKVF
ncbi:vacuolar protein sorting-associated protein 45 [Boothiomyces macroporosus]|uniref:Vacuolar protein sorting-associated protein 45 n=1 Tax=Boothiomyces macroporosus TaxID=261099 RepID=A0AAD5UQA4_9FUNG|nr:vacuolar protein sorting-associated protein 45 [Boothiomyces macroporosus]